MRTLTTLTCAALLAGCAQMEGMMPWLNMGAQTASQMGYGKQDQVAGAIKQALELGSQRASAELSASGGYSQSGYRLTLPEGLQPVANTLRSVGFGGVVDKAETTMNLAAEQAAAEALPVFEKAIKAMTVEDALGIVSGDQTAATRYFRAQTEASLRGQYAPIVQDHLKQTGFYSQYQTMLAAYDKLPLTNKPNLNAEDYIIDQALDALFDRIGKEEALIRRDPVGRGTALIGAIFGPQGGAQ